MPADDDSALQQLHSALQLFSEGFALYDRDERFVISNHVFNDLHAPLKDCLKPGRRMEEILRARVAAGLVPDAVGQEDAWIANRLADLRSERSSYVVRNDKGRWVQSRTRRTSDGGTLVTAIDITKQKELELELSEQNRKLESLVQARTAQLEEALETQVEANEVQRRVVMTLNHELRTPLAIMDAEVRRIQRKYDKLSEAALNAGLNRIKASINRLVQLSENTLTSAKIENQALDISFETVDVAKMLTELADDARRMSPNATIELDIAALPDALVLDKSLIKLAFANIISNAIKYSDGEASLNIRATNADGAAEIAFADLGIGIPRDEVPRIGQKYFRATSTQGRAGNGVGLATTKQVLQLHGGDLLVASELGVGSTFTVVLPIDFHEDTGSTRVMAI